MLGIVLREPEAGVAEPLRQPGGSTVFGRLGRRQAGAVRRGRGRARTSRHTSQRPSAQAASGSAGDPCLRSRPPPPGRSRGDLLQHLERPRPAAHHSRPSGLRRLELGDPGAGAVDLGLGLLRPSSLASTPSRSRSSASSASDARALGQNVLASREVGLEGLGQRLDRRAMLAHVWRRCAVKVLTRHPVVQLVSPLILQDVGIPSSRRRTAVAGSPGSGPGSPAFRSSWNER